MKKFKNSRLSTDSRKLQTLALNTAITRITKTEQAISPEKRRQKQKQTNRQQHITALSEKHYIFLNFTVINNGVYS